MNISFSPKKHKSFPFFVLLQFCELSYETKARYRHFSHLNIKSQVLFILQIWKKKHFSKALVHREALFAVKICPCLSF